MSEGEYIWISSIVGGVTRLHIPTGKSDYYQYNEDARLSSLSHSDAYGVVALDNDSYIAVTWNGYTLLAPEENDPSKLSANALYEYLIFAVPECRDKNDFCLL